MNSWYFKRVFLCNIIFIYHRLSESKKGEGPPHDRLRVVGDEAILETPLLVMDNDEASWKEKCMLFVEGKTDEVPEPSTLNSGLVE